jgi:hypothetical protein
LYHLNLKDFCDGTQQWEEGGGQGEKQQQQWQQKQWQQLKQWQQQWH